MVMPGAARNLGRAPTRGRATTDLQHAMALEVPELTTAAGG